MKKILLGSLLILSAFNLNFAQTAKVKQPPTAATAKAVEVPFVNKVLPNGLEIIVLADKSVPIATVELAVRNGSFTEPPELNGLSHLYEHMFFKPNQASLLYRCELALQYGNTNYYTGARCGETIKLKPQIGNVAYLNDAEQLDIFNGTTREEVVNYYYTTTSPFLLSAMRLINDAVRFPTFDAEELAQEKQVVIGEIDRNEGNPFFYLDRALKEKLFYKYPTRKQPLG
ncbi:MAG: insulinase family protein, partial [Acidobacteriota bacterium]|nr:insulinase family protein [Acidobacteriota bacterium]